MWVIRDELKLTGTKFGCGIGQCGACTVHVNGAAVRSCSTPVKSIAKQKVTTIEGLAQSQQLKTGQLTPVQQAWVDNDVPQCGYCQAGQIMAATDFLKKFPSPTDVDIRNNMTNICRCGTYTRVQLAIKQAAKAIKAEQKS